MKVTIIAQSSNACMCIFIYMCIFKKNILFFSYILLKYLQQGGEICFRVNRGFEEQLCLYEAMQYQVDTCNPLYKQYRLTKIAEKYPHGTHTHMHKNVCLFML